MQFEANEFSAFNQKQINLPKNNRKLLYKLALQDINNFDFNSNNSSKNYNKSGFHQSNYKNKFDFAN